MKLKTVCFYMETFQENLDHQTIPKKTLTNQIFIRPFINIYLKKIRLLQKVESSNYVRCTRAKGGEKKKSGNAMGGAMSGNGGGELDMTQK